MIEKDFERRCTFALTFIVAGHAPRVAGPVFFGLGLGLPAGGPLEALCDMYQPP